ncbi:MAG: hypothetical protein ACERKD_22080 [Prolixibacteraceae bacterium]
MANVIIGIHGLGNKPTKEVLEHWWKQAMIEGLKSNQYKTLLPKFELVYWSDIVHEKPLDLNETDENSPYFLDEKYTKAADNFPAEDHSTLRKVIDFINRQLHQIFLNDDLTLNYSYIADTIISKYFKDLEIYYTEDCTLENEATCKAKELIKQRLITVLEKYKKHQIMLVAHSMGSIIAFDVLRFVAPQIPIDTLVTIGSPLGLPVVISKIAAEQKLNHQHFNHMVTPQSVTKNWFNFSDILDKVAFSYNLSAEFKENNSGVKPIDFLVVNNYEINENRNPHKSFGYLRTPEFSKVLNEFILSERINLKQKIVRIASQIIQKIGQPVAPKQTTTTNQPN